MTLTLAGWSSSTAPAVARAGGSLPLATTNSSGETDCSAAKPASFAPQPVAGLFETDLATHQRFKAVHAFGVDNPHPWGATARSLRRRRQSRSTATSPRPSMRSPRRTAARPSLPQTSSTWRCSPSRSGVAVVFSPLAPLCKHNCKGGLPARYRDYLAATSDGGQTWRTTGKLPPTSIPERPTHCNWRSGTRMRVTCRAPTRPRPCSPKMRAEPGRRCAHTAGLRPFAWVVIMDRLGLLPGVIVAAEWAVPEQAPHLPARTPDTRQRDAYPDRR